MTDHANVTDVALIHRVVSGDEKAADLFVARFTRLVWWVLTHQLRLDPEPAGELYQDVFLHLWRDNYRRLRNWEGEGDFAAYLTPVVRNLALDRLRARHPERYGDFPEDEDVPEAPGPTVEEQAWIEQQRDLLDEAVAGLSERQQQLYGLRFVEEMSYEEIATMLQITVNNVGVRISRLVRDLRDAVPGEAVRSPGLGPSSR